MKRWRAGHWAGVLIALGVVLRVARWGWGRSLWLDEILLAMNLRGKTFGGLLGPLDYRQGAGVGFLWAEKGMMKLVGESERGMRVLPLVAGCLALWWMWEVARRLVGARAGLWAVGILSVLEPAVYYSSEVKQYSMDLAVALGVMWGFLWFREKATWGRAGVLLGVGMVGMLMSMPAVFVLAGCGVGLMVGRQGRGKLMVIGLGWGVFGAVEYWLFLRHLANERGLSLYWAEGFMPPWPAAGMWLLMAVKGLFGDYATMWLLWPMVGVGVAAVGLVRMARRSPVRPMFVMGPVLVTLLAAAMKRYPFSGRLILFLVPSGVLMMAGAVRVRWMKWVVLGGIILPAVVREGVYLVRPPGREELREVLGELAVRVKSGDVVYVYRGAHAGWDYYAGQAGLNNVPVIEAEDMDVDPAAMERDARKLEGIKGRVWVVYSHTPTGQSWDGRLEALIGKSLERIEARGAGAYLYEF